MKPNRQFLQLKDEWYNKLSETGFEDIETKSGQLKQHDIRTIAFKNREMIKEFFMNLDYFLTKNPDLPELEKTVLTLYTEGTHIKIICRQTEKSYFIVKKIINKYKNIILRNK